MRPTSWIHGRPAQAALRTYALSLSLSLGPSIVPFLTALLTSRASEKTSLRAFKRVLRRELGLDGFAFAMSISVGGGMALREIWRLFDVTLNKHPKARKAVFNLSSTQKTFISNFLSSIIGILLVKAGRDRSYRIRRDLLSPITSIPLTSPTQAIRTTHSIRTSNTMDLTLLLVVRALDCALQTVMRKLTENRLLEVNVDGTAKGQQSRTSNVVSGLTATIDAFVFWVCSARIMWCFFYEPERLPKSYVKWIATLANLDNRIIQALRLLREGRWSYLLGSKSHSHILTSLAGELGYQPSLGDPAILPAYGGVAADATWKVLGVSNRPRIGGIPCELVHGSVGRRLGLQGSCVANWSIRGVMAFFEAIAIYLPVHFLPVLLTRPRALLIPHRTIRTLLGTLRSASFLSAFVTLYWIAVCTTRSLVLARLFPTISHDFWDGPFGCIFAGSLACGGSIWIERGRRRGEMALYVLPRAIRACLPDTWIRYSNKKARFIECLAFALSFATLTTAVAHRPETLRGLSRWTLSFITDSHAAGSRKSTRRNPNSLDTSASDQGHASKTC